MAHAPEIPLQGPTEAESPFSAAGRARARRRRRRTGGAADGETAPGPDLARAAALNPRFGRSLGWISHRPRIAALLGFTASTPDELGFARALALWQQRNGLTPDGILGPRTWARLSPLLGRGSGSTTPTQAPAAVPGSAFLKDSPRLRAVPLSPSRPIAVESSWSSERRALARTYNRLGGLMRALSQEVGFELPAALAVWRVESGGREHTPGRLIIRFENHVFFRSWGERNRSLYDRHFRHGGHNGHPGRSWEGHQIRGSESGAFEPLHTGSQEDEYRALRLATRLAGDDIALRCISMGGPQVMGFNHGKLGYASPRQMYDAFQADERFHVLGFFDFCRETPAPARGDLVRHLRERNWNEFARFYNGSGQVAAYGGMIARSFQEAATLPGVGDAISREVPPDADALPLPPEDPLAGLDAPPEPNGNGAEPPEDAPEPADPADPPAWITADGFVLQLPPAVIHRILERITPPDLLPEPDLDPLRRGKRVLRRGARKGVRKARKGVRKARSGVRRLKGKTKRGARKVRRLTGRLVQRARRVGTLRDRATGRELPVFAGRNGAIRYRIVARSSSPRDAQILEIAPESDELEVPSDGQLTPSFNIREFYSGVVGKSGKTDPVPARYHADVLELARNLQVLRDHLGKPIRINSGYRNPAYNKHIGGATDSQHLYAKAGDLHVAGVTPAQVYCTIESLIAAGRMKQGGLGIYNTFVHYDIRGSRARWTGSGASYPNCSTTPPAVSRPEPAQPTVPPPTGMPAAPSPLPVPYPISPSWWPDSLKRLSAWLWSREA
jgi:hypothetical protein